MAKKALGKGLGAIISTSPAPLEDFEKSISGDSERIVELDVEKINPNPHQPRIFFDDTKIKELSDSIKSVGLIQPIIVRKEGKSYFLVAGERRLRAAKLAGIDKIKSIIINADEENYFSMALIENIQRSDLDPIEEAKAYRFLISKFKLKQQNIASKVGKDRATIANSLRLLNLPDSIQEGLSKGKISAGHAKLLLSVQGTAKQKALYNRIVSKSLSVRAVEKIINEEINNKSSLNNKTKAKNAHIKKMENKLISRLGTKVEIKHSGNRGKIEISYYSLDDFERIIDLIK